MVRFLILIVICFFSIELVSGQLTPTQTVSIPMRDGQFLAGDVYIPDHCSTCPVVLIQTPYDKSSFENGLPLGYLQNVNTSPYIWVIVDWRGFYASSSAAVAQPDRGEDGYDVIEWITQQSWSNGKVGTWGPSALGVIQYQTAREQHPAHICAVPLVADPQTCYQCYFYGGALEESRLATMDILGYGLSPMVLSNPYYSIAWQYVENNGWYPQEISIPTLQIGGWYDHNIDQMMSWYEATRNEAAVSVRDKQWLLVGPWVHGGTGAAYVGSSVQGELTYPDAAFRSDIMARQFFEYHLLNDANGWENTPLITYYETGLGSWGGTNAVSIENESNGILYLSDNNRLQHELGIGATGFVSDPGNPSPTIGGQTLTPLLDQGPYDQTSLESRNDVVTFSSPVLQNNYTVSGRVVVKLYVASDRPDADLVVRLVDQYPDGRNMLINDGIRRIRFRNGYSESDEAFMQPGEIYEVEVELPFVNYTWNNGHQIKILVSGNSSPRWDVNLQDGGEMYTGNPGVSGTLIIHHDEGSPSRVMLPGEASPLLLPENNAEHLLRVYPNPVEDKLYWVSNEQTVEEIAVFAVSGRMLRRIAPEQSNTISVTEFPSGIYLVKFRTAEGIYTHKVTRK